MGTENIKIKMLKHVRPDFFFLPQIEPGTELFKDVEYEATTNRNGAISGICQNGQLLGVKPGEFEFVEAPQWVLDIHEEYWRKNRW